MTKACVFIDGENLRHSLTDLFKGVFRPEGYLPKKADWEGFFDHLASKADEETVRFRTYWYVVEQVDFFPYNFPGDEGALYRLLVKHDKYRKGLDSLEGEDRAKQAQKYVEELKQRKAKFAKRFSGWAEIQKGIALSHKAIEFRRAGSIRYNLFKKSLGGEKAVDVKLAVDLLELRNIYDLAVIVSGDQDYVPAVQVIKDSGKQVVNVSFKKKDGDILPGGARRLNLIADNSLILDYAAVESFMNFSAAEKSRA